MPGRHRETVLVRCICGTGRKLPCIRASPVIEAESNQRLGAGCAAIEPWVLGKEMNKMTLFALNEIYELWLIKSDLSNGWKMALH